MAVMTLMDAVSADAVLATYGLSLVDFTPTALGIENTNYFVTARERDGARERRLVLTILEDGRTPCSFLTDLLAELTRAGLPVPALLRTTLGYAYASYPAVQTLDAAGMSGAVQPVLLCQRLPGVHRHVPTAADCAAIGRFLARMHRAAAALLDIAPVHPRQGSWLVARRAELRHTLAAWQVVLIDEAVAYAIALLQRTDYAALPEAVVHGDLFRDNALFLSEGLAGVIDFHHAARHKRVFDIAVSINDWCMTPDSQIDEACAFALLAGYQSLAGLTLGERLLLPAFLTYAALTFALSRLQAGARDAQRPNKSALPMLLKLNHHLRDPWFGRSDVSNPP